MSTQVNNEKKDASYWALYLKKYLSEEGDRRALDEAFVDGRAAAAETEFEFQFSHGMTVNQAEECAIRVLMDGLE